MIYIYWCYRLWIHLLMVKCERVERSTFMPLIKSVNTHRCIEKRYKCFVLQFHYIFDIFWDMHRRQGSSQWKESCWKWDRMLQDLNTLISSACHIFIAAVVSSPGSMTDLAEENGWYDAYVCDVGWSRDYDKLLYYCFAKRNLSPPSVPRTLCVRAVPASDPGR